MGCHIVYDQNQNLAVLYCSTSEWAFGPVFSDEGDHDANDRAEAFCRWLGETDTWAGYEKEPIQTSRRDPRELTDIGLQAAYHDWLLQEADQWVREDTPLFTEGWTD